MIERRRRRSNDPRLALTFLLDSLAERNALRAISLADERGHLIASSGRDTVRLAHAGRKVVVGEDDPTFDDVARGHDVFAARVRLTSGNLVLTTLGGRVKSVRDASASIARILRV